MVLNNVIKIHKAVIKNGRLIDQTPSKTVTFHEQRTITLEGMVRYGTIIELVKVITVLNNVTKFHKTLIKTNQLRTYVRTDSGNIFIPRRLFYGGGIKIDH